MSTSIRLVGLIAGVGLVARPPMPAPARAVSQGVPVRLFLDQPRYAPGTEGRVRVETGEDGYLLVLYAQPDGHVNVAYPLDPGRSDDVDADTSIEIVTRGGESAFTVEDSSGTGTWYAAISSRPFRLDSIALHGHWDYRRVPRIEDPANVESQLTSFVQTLSRGRFDYDIVSFVIDTAAPRPSSSLAPPASGPGVANPPTLGPAGSAPPPEPPDWWPGLLPAPWWGPPWPGPYYDRVGVGALGLAAPRPGVAPVAGPASAAPAGTPPPSDTHQQQPDPGETRHGDGGEGHASSHWHVALR